jgi:hypothetical protein
VRRRDFITLLGGAAAWPLAVRAQQGENIRRVCVLTAGVGAEDRDAEARNAAFVLALQQLGWTSGRNLRRKLPSSHGARLCRSRDVGEDRP